MKSLQCGIRQWFYFYLFSNPNRLTKKPLKDIVVYRGDTLPKKDKQTGITKEGSQLFFGLKALEK